MKYLAITGIDCPECAIKNLLQQEGIADIVVLPPDELIDSPIATHADTILFIHKSKLYCHKSYAEKNKLLINRICQSGDFELIVSDEERSGIYPFDCGYNALYVPGTDDYVIGNKKALAEPLQAVCSINTRQGYAACAAIAARGAVATADPSIKKAAEAAGIDVFELTGGDIILHGYDTGFIGGCTGVMKRTVFVTGDPELCTTGKEIREFCRIHSLDLISLCPGILTDVGGIKFVECK